MEKVEGSPPPRSVALLPTNLESEAFRRFGVNILTAAPMFEALAIDVTVLYIRVCFIAHCSIPQVQNYS